MVDSIFHKLVDKKRETPTWKPADLNDPSISEEIVARSWFDRQKSKTLDLAPLMDENEITTGTKQDNSTWGEFRAWGIPSEQVIKSYIDGSAKSSGAFALTEKQVKQKLVNDLAERFEIDVGKNEKWANTIRDRVAEVVKNCCSVEDGHKEQYLKWRGYSSA
jgi:3-hydroxyisobutyryl-CoA hydrolase